MATFRTLVIPAAAAAFVLVGCAQPPVAKDAPYPDAAPSAASGAMPMGGHAATMARMDGHMKLMREMHEKMMRAKTPEERSALMPEHMKVMQEGMAMMASMRSMGSMGAGGMMGKGGMGAMGGKHGDSGMAGDMATHHAMMEKQMEMMQSMMQMMSDRMPPATGRL